MKNKLNLILMFSLLFFLIVNHVEGDRGGGRGGGGGARGGGVSRNNISRTPSMSRAYSPKARTQPAQLPRSRTPNNSKEALRGRIQPSESRTQINQYLKQSRDIQKINRPENIQKFQDLKARMPEQTADRRRSADQIRQHLRETYPERKGWYNDRFWDNHHYHPGYYYQGRNVWRAASWVGLNNWLSWGWNQPIYYESGSPIYLPADTASIQWENLPPPPQEYTEVDAGQQNNLAQETDQNPADWMDLGVFAVGNDKTDALEANMVFQLALSKGGIIEGAYYNTATDQVYPVEGEVDRATQIAAWKMSLGTDSPIFETGIYNLTKDETPVQVHFSDGSTQNWLLVRMAAQ